MKTKLTYRLFTLLFCCMLLLAAGCRQDREDRSWQNQNFTLDEDLVQDSRDSVDFIIRKSMLHNTQFSTFSANMEIKLLMEDESGKDAMKIGLGGQIRIQKDSILWLSCTKLIELGRMRITPDSLLLYSKFGNTGSVYTDDSLQMMPMMFKLMQCLFMRQTDSVMLRGNRTLTHSDSLQWNIDGIVADSLTWRISINKTSFRPDALYLQITYHQTTLQLKLHYFEENGFELAVAQDRKILAKVQIRYLKPRWNNELSYPLSFPASATIEVNRGLMNNMQDNPF